MREHGDILKQQTLHMTNVLSFHKKLSPIEVKRETERIGEFIKGGGFVKTGPTVTATFSVEQQGQLMDIEILVPLDKPFVPPEGCVCKPEFLLTNAVTIRHIGNPMRLQDTCNKLLAHIQECGLQPITGGYNVAVREVKTPAEIDQMMMDVYIGISPNIL